MMPKRDGKWRRRDAILFKEMSMLLAAEDLDSE